MGSQNRPKMFPEIYPRRSGFRSCDCMVLRWLQDRLKRAPGEVLGCLGGLLGPLWTVLGGFWAVLTRSWAALRCFWALFERSWRSGWIFEWFVLDRFGVRFVDSIHRFVSMMRFVESIRYFVNILSTQQHGPAECAKRLIRRPPRRGGAERVRPIAKCPIHMPNLQILKP